MAYELYENDDTSKVRLHETDCKWGPGADGGNSGSVRTFDSYDEAWEYMNNNFAEDDDYGDCGHCLGC